MQCPATREATIAPRGGGRALAATAGLGLLAALVFLLSRCGRGAPEAPSSPRAGTAGAASPAPVDACALLPAEDVEAVAGDLTGTLNSTLDGAVGRDPAQCAYAVGSDVPPRMVSLQVRRSPDVKRAARLHAAARSGLAALGGGSGEGPRDVAGLGDGAFWVGGRIDQLHVLDGFSELVFTVQIPKDPLHAATRLAGKSLARLHPAAKPSGGGAAVPNTGTAGP